MTGVDRHAHTGARDLEVGQAHDLAALEAKLLLLVGLIEAIVDQRTGEREHVERDRLHEVRALVDRHRPPVVGELRTVGADLLGLLIELADTGEPGTRYGLVGRDDHRLEPGLVGKRLHDRHGDHRGAVGVGDDVFDLLIHERSLAGGQADNRAHLDVDLSISDGAGAIGRNVHFDELIAAITASLTPAFQIGVNARHFLFGGDIEGGDGRRTQHAIHFQTVSGLK